jgi:hypothetical protein
MDSRTLSSERSLVIFEEGIPSVMLIFWPYEHLHRESDSLDKVEIDKLEKAVKAATAIAERLAGVS